jgi:hypothetical protein
MNYVVRWIKDGERHGLFLRDAEWTRALAYARALLDVHPSDIWIETPWGARLATYPDIVDPADLPDLAAAA